MKKKSEKNSILPAVMVQIGSPKHSVTLNQEDHKFKPSLGNLARPGLKT